MSVVFEIRGLTVERGRRRVLDLPALNLEAGGFVAVLGHNGSGKSTLLGALSRAVRPDAGSILLDGAPLERLSSRALARRVAALPQRPPEAPGMLVRELVALGRYPWRGALGRWDAEDAAAVEAALAAADLDAFAEREVDRLSGGERQRAWIAMLLAQQAPVLLLDEPTAALDLVREAETLALLRRLNRERGRTVVAALHDVNAAARVADRLIALRDGRVVFDGPPETLLAPGPLAAIYGAPFAVLDRPDGAGRVAVLA